MPQRIHLLGSALHRAQVPGKGAGNGDWLGHLASFATRRCDIAGVYLNEDMLTAWRLFIGAEAWGWFDTRNLDRRLYKAGWPRGVRVYNLRHSVGLALSEQGEDLADIQAHMGHRSASRFLDARAQTRTSRDFS